MMDQQTVAIEQIQKMIVVLVAMNPAGQGLSLIGGFRYRFLDCGARRSMDIDYHWEGDLEQKQIQLVELFRRRLIPEVRRKFRYEGSAGCATGPESESVFVKIVDLAFWRDAPGGGRIEIPVDITRMVCLDAPVVRTAEGVVYRTASDADMIEGKVLALFNRTRMEHRDLLDIFLFSSHLAANSGERMKKKMEMLKITPAMVNALLGDLAGHNAYHVRALESIISGQMDPAAGSNIKDAGGAKVVLDSVTVMLRDRLGLVEEDAK